MRCTASSILAALAAPLLVSARPIRRGPASATDAVVFQFASVLNQLEAEFYAQALSKFKDSDFTAAGFSMPGIATQMLKQIQANEAMHIGFIEKTLIDNGATPQKCNFKFDSALSDVPTLAATARVVEVLGVSAFLGGATLIDDPVLLDAAASILTIEARHSTILNILSGTGSSIPSPFDIPFTPQETLAIASPFIDGPCDLKLTPTNTLTITNKDPVTAGTLLTFSGTNVTGTDGLFCNMIVGGASFSINLPLAECVVPNGINGPVAIWITSDAQPLVNNVVDRAKTQQVAGPTLTFIDSQPEMLVQMVRSSGGSGSANGQAAAPASTPLPKDFTGLSPDGKVTVEGLSEVPAPAPTGA
ncbi:ferritin-like domain-containing protein [Mycena vulgaris]|nr:ferritin-like domain-containing protein [Mycena vulgaris]